MLFQLLGRMHIMSPHEAIRTWIWSIFFLVTRRRYNTARIAASAATIFTRRILMNVKLMQAV